ncbi:unnamed protein product [Rotaria sp. Silwood2]|nr:unnamed protein product [Rotaria sp. Silwood2]
MANDQWISIFDYLRSNTGFNDRNFIIIRERYQQQCGGSFPELYDESAVKEVARQLKIKINTAEYLDLLRDCIFSSSMKDSRTLAELSWTKNNGQSESWLKGLRQEDIFSFEHLNNLNQFEWDRIHALSVNAKRILKVAVDRERTSFAGERRRRVIDEPNDENKEQTDTTSVEDSSITDSELFANLHLIKLFIWHKLRDQPAVQSHGALAKLEMKCLNVAFEEMRFEGFVDDVLFPKIREFFLPLTISEQELHVKRSSNQTARLTRSKELRKQIKLYTTKLDKLNDDDQKCNEETLQIEQLIKDHEVEHFQVLTTWKSKKSNKKQQKQLETLHRIYQNCLKDQENFLKQRHKLKQEKERTQKTINEWQNKIEWTKECLQTIEMELNTPHKPVQKQIVKPPRGLIMYGPPGTGKSDILSKLAKKLGIIMVGPPLAAGELNRPLVGESERILIALCSRCYQVPYAMCCVSIDEIDSLAPKRDADSSEGKVDKISVLLSLIEGIKNVPNLMILSATNRLHMMDEAFLRRMSGKIFVGRPSSNARRRMLQTIPYWALEPELLDRLSTARYISLAIQTTANLLNTFKRIQITAGGSEKELKLSQEYNDVIGLIAQCALVVAHRTSSSKISFYLTSVDLYSSAVVDSVFETSVKNITWSTSEPMTVTQINIKASGNDVTCTTLQLQYLTGE